MFGCPCQFCYRTSKDTNVSAHFSSSTTPEQGRDELAPLESSENAAKANDKNSFKPLRQHWWLSQNIEKPCVCECLEKSLKRLGQGLLG
jgi:hypothetical protein